MRNWEKHGRLFLVIGYIVFILTKTIIGRPVQPEPIFKPLFWEVQAGFWTDIVMNILLFIPLGFLIGGKKGIVAGFILSCSIEMIQYYGRLGYCEMDDILNNTIGASVGSLLLLFVDSFAKVLRNTR